MLNLLSRSNTLMHCAHRTFESAKASQVRAKGQAFGSSATVSWLVPVSANNNGGLVFIFFGLVMTLQPLLFWKVIPETKGTSLEDLEYTLHVHNGHPGQPHTATST
jgi:hypothetical protein